MRQLVLLSFGLLVLGQMVEMRQLPFFGLKQADNCVGRCGAGPNDGSASCYCNTACAGAGDCCSDYNTVCFTCQDRCFEGYDPNAPCACNSECPDHGNCCSDHDSICGSTGGSVTDQELLDLSRLLFSLEINDAGQYIDWDVQGQTTNGGSDQAPGPLLTRFDSASVWALPTAGLLYQMFDNYVPDVNAADEPDAQQLAEENAFLDAVLATPVMNEAYNFLSGKGLFSDQAQFRAKLFEMWFDPYSRASSGSELGSSGFEHVFIGESKNGEVSGFHGWYHYADEEQNGRTDYYGHLGMQDVADFGRPGYGGATIVYTWNGEMKPIGGFFIGTSPELDFAVKSVCWLLRAGENCVMEFGGWQFKIVSYNNDGKHIATAYPDFTP